MQPLVQYFMLTQKKNKTNESINYTDISRDIQFFPSLSFLGMHDKGNGRRKAPALPHHNGNMQVCVVLRGQSIPMGTIILM